jgi:hypothetical protein
MLGPTEKYRSAKRLHVENGILTFLGPSGSISHICRPISLGRLKRVLVFVGPAGGDPSQPVVWRVVLLTSSGKWDSTQAIFEVQTHRLIDGQVLQPPALTSLLRRLPRSVQVHAPNPALPMIPCPAFRKGNGTNDSDIHSGGFCWLFPHAQHGILFETHRAQYNTRYYPLAEIDRVCLIHHHERYSLDSPSFTLNLDWRSQPRSSTMGRTPALNSIAKFRLHGHVVFEAAVTWAQQHVQPVDNIELKITRPKCLSSTFFLISTDLPQQSVCAP